MDHRIITKIELYRRKIRLNLQPNVTVFCNVERQHLIFDRGHLIKEIIDRRSMHAVQLSRHNGLCSEVSAKFSTKPLEITLLVSHVKAFCLKTDRNSEDICEKSEN